MALHTMLLMLFVTKILIRDYVERMLPSLAKVLIFQKVQATAITIQQLILKAITICLLRKS